MDTYLKILSYGKADKAYLLLGIFNLLLYNIFGAVSLTLIIPFLEILFNPSTISAPLVALDWWSVSTWKEHGYYQLSIIMDTYGRMNALWGFCFTLAIAIFFKNLFKYLSSWCIITVEQNIIRRIRENIFDHLLKLSLRFYTLKKKGHIVSVVVNDVQVIQEAVIGTLNAIFSDPMTMIIFFIGMLLLSWKLTAFTLIVLPITGIILGRIAKKLKHRARKGQTYLDHLIAILDEFISGIRIIKAFSSENYERERYRSANTLYSIQMISLRRYAELASPLTEFFSILVVLGIIIYGGSMILSDQAELKASEFIGFIALFSQFLAPLKTFSSAISRIQKANVSYQRIEELLSEKVQSTENETGFTLNEFNSSIQVKEVSFKYGEKYVLQDINLTIPKGSTVALVGKSGSGKTTLADLICRFYDPSEGCIEIDGQDLKKFTSSSIRKMMGVVSQEAILFNDSVVNNIAYSKLNYSIDEVKQAAKVANADEFIRNLENGYETNIGERGTRLSGGQRQRLSIARAVLKNPPILILDEATSALDTHSERDVQQALERLMTNRTCIVIAHRLTTITHADLIVVLENGKIVEQGNHQTLMDKKGAYFRLFFAQNE